MRIERLAASVTGRRRVDQGRRRVARRRRRGALPLEQLVQVGATVALGVLLDTFVVRALLIPAITYLCGERLAAIDRSLVGPE